MAAATARLEADAKKAQDEVARLREAGAESAKTLAAATKELELLKATRPPEVEIEGAKQIPEGPDQLKQSLAQIARDEAEITTLRAAAAETDKKLAAATSELEAMKASHPADAQAVEAMKATTEERDRLKEELAARSKELADAENRHNEEMAKVRVALEQARQQRDALEKQIASGATAGAADKPAALRLDQLEARIAVLEAKPVPYTPEERALLKISVASAPAEPPEASVSPAHVHSIKDLPPGTGILWSEAMRASVAGDFGAAEEKYKEVLRQDETNVFVLAFLANTQFAAGHLGDCEKTVKRALAVDPEDPGSLYLLGLLRYRQERLDEAIDALSLSAKINPTNSATQNFLGCVLADKGLRPAAETAFRKALQSEPDYADAHFNLAIVYAESQPPSWELARWHYRRALALGHTKSATLDKALGENGGQAKP
jgi:tetratricopeptide (TPR) repeat protein